MELDEFISEIEEKEKLYNLYDHKINDITIYRIIRFNTRVKYLKKIGFTNKTRPRKINIFKTLIVFIRDLFFIVKLIFSKSAYDLVFFEFPRVFNSKKSYYEKITHPLIHEVKKEKEVLIFKGINSFKNNNFSLGQLHSLSTKTFCILTALFLAPSFYLLYMNKLNNFLKSLGCVVKLGMIEKLKIITKTTVFFVEHHVFGHIFKLLKVKQIVVGGRESYLPQLAAAKKLKVLSFEMQHGITRSKTPYYTGEYDKFLDPDFFLTFGKEWKGKFFGVPQSKIINIGWGSSKYRYKHLNRGKSSEVLVASSPELTEKILTFLRLAKEINIKFSFRTHPQEQLNLQQMDLIASLKNVALDNSLDSEEAIAKFDYILGHNSSILFEAACFGKTIMVFNTLEIPAVNSKQILKYGFHLISNPSDIEQVFKLPKTEPILKSNFYSIFEPNNFIKCLKE